MHATLHPLHQTQWDEKTQRLGGEQASSVTLNAPLLTTQQISSMWLLSLSAESSTRSSTWVCGKTFAWGGLDLPIAESSTSFWWGECNPACLPMRCVISVQLKAATTKPNKCCEWSRRTFSTQVCHSDRWDVALLEGSRTAGRPSPPPLCQHGKRSVPDGHHQGLRQESRIGTSPNSHKIHYHLDS